MQETWVRSLDWEDPLRRKWQPTPVFLPVIPPWTEEPGRLQSMGLQRVRHDWVHKTLSRSRAVIVTVTEWELRSQKTHWQHSLMNSKKLQSTEGQCIFSFFSSTRIFRKTTAISVWHPASLLSSSHILLSLLVHVEPPPSHTHHKH